MQSMSAGPEHPGKRNVGPLLEIIISKSVLDEGWIEPSIPGKFGACVLCELFEGMFVTLCHSSACLGTSVVADKACHASKIEVMMQNLFVDVQRQDHSLCSGINN